MQPALIHPLRGSRCGLASFSQLSSLAWCSPWLPPNPRRTLHSCPPSTSTTFLSSLPISTVSLALRIRHSSQLIGAAAVRGAPAVAVTAKREVDDVDMMCALMQSGPKTTRIAHAIWERTVRPGDVVLDATCGNGNDTLALARLALESQPTTGTAETSAETGSPHQALVYALDIQPQALHATQSTLATQLSPAQMERVKFVETCHSKLGDFIPPGSARLVSFNLGYLPGGDKNVVTRGASTEAALTAALTAVAPGGLISIVAYVGHPEGRMEYDSVVSFVGSLPSDRWVCSHHQWANRRRAPSLFLLYKR